MVRDAGITNFSGDYDSDSDSEVSDSDYDSDSTFSDSYVNNSDSDSSLNLEYVEILLKTLRRTDNFLSWYELLSDMLPIEFNTFLWAFTIFLMLKKIKFFSTFAVIPIPPPESEVIPIPTPILFQK